MFCGHHSFLEVMEMWNRLLDYVAIYHPDQLPVGTFPTFPSNQPYMDNPCVEESLPYGRVGDYRHFLHASYADTVLERTQIESQHCDAWLHLAKHKNVPNHANENSVTRVGLFSSIVRPEALLTKETPSRSLINPSKK